ncbi:MAG: glycine cleavage system protein GcvH [Gemmatimonadetes bacterium]|nr:glycine cleavage system protein GcvH [Gemmatimonadota bacterium]
MAQVRGCNIPEDRYYWVEKHVWIIRDGDVATVGITDVAQNLAKKVVAVTPKKAGKAIKAGKSVATVESGKWVGPVLTPVGGEVVEVNAALAGDPELVNRDPYGEGWIVRLKPDDWDGDMANMPEGAAALTAYESFLAAEGIECGR